jgi:D-xylose transport system substrate-binding protein
LVACQRIVAGTQAMTIYKPVKLLATKAAELAMKLARGQPVIANAALNNGKTEVPAVLLDVVTVTKENLMATVIKDGFQTYADVYRDQPANQRPPAP